MKSTPNVNGNGTANGANGSNGNPSNGAGFKIKPGAITPVSQLIAEAKEKNPDAITEPTTYPQPQVPEQEAPQAEPAPEPTVQASTPPAEPVTPAPAPVQPAAPTRSRADEIEFQIDKSRQLQLINQQLQNLKSKLAELKQFSFEVDKDDNHRYGRIAIFDDNNREFNAKNHGLAALVVESLKAVFNTKIEEKETELLAVASRE
ncbi:hypothetical protein [Spirosoma fluminis]